MTKLRKSLIPPAVVPPDSELYQPLDSDLTDIASLTTTSFGRGFLTQSDQATSRSYIGAGSSSFSGAFADLSGIPTTISGYGITDFNSLGDARWSLLGHTHSYQPLDAALTALAGLTIAADSLSIGTGADAFSQTTFAANTFPAKASSLGLVAKTITDFALTILDDADAATVRATIGAGTSSTSGTVTSFSAGDLSPLFTTSEATATTTPALTFTLNDVAGSVFFGHTGASATAPSFLSTSTTRTALSIDNVDNTSDANKPVSTAQQTALDLKANLISPSFTTPALGTPSSGTLTNCTGLPIAGISGLGTNIATFLGATQPTTIGGYGITDFNSLGDARWQAADAGLTSLAGLSATGSQYYLDSADHWATIKYLGLKFSGGVLSTQNYLNVAPGALPADSTIASASTLDLTGVLGPVIDVTGTTDITSITGLADGTEAMLRFTGAGLTLVKGSTLDTIGGADLTTTANGVAMVTGGAAGLVTVTDYQSADGYSTQTFDNIFMNPGANIGFTPGSSWQFDIGRGDAESGGNFVRMQQNDKFSLHNNNGEANPEGQAQFDTRNLLSLSSFLLPWHNGDETTFATQEGDESLTNKKLGSLTTNGFVKTSGSDGTLSVDTATYLTGNESIALSGDVSGTGTTAITTTIGAGKVTLAMQANMATASVVYRKTAGSGAPEVNTLATLKTDLAVPTVTVSSNAIAKGDGAGNLSISQIKDDGTTVTIGELSAAGIATEYAHGWAYITSTDIANPGLLFVDQADSGRLYSYLLSTDTDFLAPDDVSVPTTLAVASYNLTKTGEANAYTDSSLASATIGYHTLMEASASVTATQTSGKYGLYSGEASVLSGASTVYPLKTIYIAAADYPALASSATAHLRIRAQLYTNDVAPTGNWTFGLYPITRPGTSGGAGVCIYTIGTVVSGSNGATFTTPAADGLHSAVGSDFALPADGHYCIAVVTTATVATSAHVHLVGALQIHYDY